MPVFAVKVACAAGSRPHTTQLPAGNPSCGDGVSTLPGAQPGGGGQNGGAVLTLPGSRDSTEPSCVVGTRAELDAPLALAGVVPGRAARSGRSRRPQEGQRTAPSVTGSPQLGQDVIGEPSLTRDPPRALGRADSSDRSRWSTPPTSSI